MHIRWLERDDGVTLHESVFELMILIELKGGHPVGAVLSDH
jgi:hypothetical protein